MYHDDMIAQLIIYQRYSIINVEENDFEENDPLIDAIFKSIKGEGYTIDIDITISKEDDYRPYIEAYIHNTPDHNRYKKYDTIFSTYLDDDDKFWLSDLAEKIKDIRKYVILNTQRA